ncbi:MAG: ATP phosphoribosyltransferase regulatory subunit [Novosphingobium sp.]
MDDSDPDLLPEGLKDRLPAEAAAATRIVQAILRVMDSHGYDRVIPPLIEFERSLAGRMAGVQPRRMFRFVDPASLRTLALRSDITPQIGRIAETRLAAAPRPLRLCYAGPVATIRGDGLDPARERLQCGAELIGRDTVAAAGEIVAMAIEALGSAGAREVSVDFTLPDLVDTLAAKALPLPPERIASVRRELDAKDAGGLVAAGGEAYLPLLYAAGPFEAAIERLSAIDAGGALASRIEGLRRIAERVGDAARITLDPTERHGFEYQSWFGFTLYAEGVRGPLGRGGTYRIMREGSEGEVATGFSLYPDALVAAGTGEPERDTLFLPLGHDPAIAARLRAIGWRTLAALDEGEDAATLGCTHRLDGAEVVEVR